MVFFFSTFPVILIILLFFALFNDMIYNTLHSDLNQNLIDRLLIFSGLIFFYYIIFVRFVSEFIHRMFGSYERILKDLDRILSGDQIPPLSLRKNDFGQDILTRVNSLIQKLPPAR